LNVLALLAKDHPNFVDSIAGTEPVGFETLVEALSAWSDLPLVFDREVVGRALDEPMGPLLADGYLPTFHPREWRERVAAADDVEPIEAGEWVTFAEASHGDRGITLPDDAATTPRISLFARLGDSVRRISLDYPSFGSQPTALSLSLPAECGLPDWGECPPGRCDGKCEPTRALGGTDRWVCRCVPLW
jgi:hypothetical protein